MTGYSAGKVKVGPYQLVSLLGQGGTGDVWEARHTASGTHVALKRLGKGDDPKLLGAAIDESRALSALKHPNVVALLESGVEGGVPWLALELVKGMSAAKLLASGARLKEGVAAYVAICVARALAAAHAAQWVHRDVTPGNVLLGFDGSVKLSDFGIAWAKERTQQTTVGTVKGTVSWMAPEQSTAGSVDARTDVFSLGAVLHALITGESPLSGENRLVDLLAGVSLPLSPMLSPEMSAIIARALSRDRSARFATAAELAEALAPLAAVDGAARLAGQLAAIPARRSAPRRSARWPVVLGVLAALVGAAWWTRPAVEPVPRVSIDDLKPILPSLKDLPKAPLMDEPEAPPPTAPEPARAPQRVETGVLAVGGEAAVRGEIFIDGRSMGFAPKQLELPVGAHQLMVTLAGGGRFGPHTVKIRTADTHSAPQRVVVTQP